MIIKCYAISQILHISNVYSMPENTCKELESILVEFLWNGKQNKVKYNTVIQDFIDGGYRMPDIRLILKLQKIKWVQKYFDSTNSMWKNTFHTAVRSNNVKYLLLAN